MTENWKNAYGDAPVYDENRAKAMYAALNQLTAGVDGVSQHDLFLLHSTLLRALHGQL